VRENRVKRELLAGNVQVGTWIHSLASPEVPRVLATAGLDYVNIDMEHSLLSMESVGHLCATALDVDLVPIVRPAGHYQHAVSRPLDNGALGILAPHVDDRATAERLVRIVRFPPQGDRGAQPPNIHQSFQSGDVAAYLAEANKQTLLMVQIESPKALENLDDILSVDGIDGATVGRGDLSAELGIAGRRGDPRILAAVEDTVASCLRNGKISGLLLNSTDEADHWIERGVRLLTFASEVIFMRNAAETAVQALTTTAAARGLYPKKT
jgi:2-keto-3-deoxy-L-rhamnonate aldolase RhmA